MTDFDVAVIGLGAMGSAALFHLARRGVKAVGIEQFVPGHDRGSSHGESRAIRLGYSEHPSYVPLVRSAFEKWRELERLSGDRLLITTGIVEAGLPGSRMVQGSLDACELHRLEHELLGAPEIMRRFPAIQVPEDYSAVWQPAGGYLQPETANAAHLRLAREAGAEVLAGAKVLGIEPRQGHVGLALNGKEVKAGAVIVAAGPWFTDFVPELRQALTVLRRVLCWYEPLSPELFRPGALPVFMIESEDDVVYGFPDFAGTGFKCASHYGTGILAHADLARQDAGPADEMRTRRFLERFMPAGAGRLRSMKTCMYTMTPDEDFIIDRLPSDERILLCSACSGHGYKFASAIGAALADLSTEGTTPHDLSRFRIDRFGARSAIDLPQS
jgi:sarcosine oxidase